MPNRSPTALPTDDAPELDAKKRLRKRFSWFAMVPALTVQPSP